MLDRLAQEYSSQIELVKVNADLEDNFELLAQYDVKSIPTLIMQGHGLVTTWQLGRLVGAQSEKNLRDWIEGILSDIDSIKESIGQDI